MRVSKFLCVCKSAPDILRAMSADFHQLVDATIDHLQSLRARGAQFIPLQPETLRALNGTVQRNGPGKIENGGLRTAPAVQGNGHTVNAAPSVPAPGARHSILETSEAAAAPALDPRPSTFDTSPKATAIAELRERAMQCVKCSHLSSTRKNVVFGVGSIDADIMFVGEAPGADEDIQGEPFVGAAG